MSRASLSLYRSEFFKTLIQYLGVALAFVPVGIAYGMIVATRGERVGLLLVLLGIGFVTAQFVWRRTEIATFYLTCSKKRWRSECRS